MTVCKQCHKEIPEVAQRKFCPYCGAASGEEGLFEYQAPQQAGETPAESGTAEPSPVEAQPYVHWEDRGRVGFLRGFSQTWSDATFRPAQFFRRAAKTGNLGSAFLFAFLLGMTSGLLSLLWQDQFFDTLSRMDEFGPLFGPDASISFRGLYALMLPFLVVIAIFLTSAIYHFCLIIVGSGQSGWEATFRAVCYSYGPQLLVLIPLCGGWIATVWQYVIMIVGWRELHQSTTGRAVLAALLPLLLCCGFIVSLLYFMRNLAPDFELPV